MVDGRDNAWRSRAPGPHAHGNTDRQAMDGLQTEASGQQKQSNDPQQQPAQPPIRQLLGATDAQTAHHIQGPGKWGIHNPPPPKDRKPILTPSLWAPRAGVCNGTEPNPPAPQARVFTPVRINATTCGQIPHEKSGRTPGAIASEKLC